jgi:hypothetical protein
MSIQQNLSSLVESFRFGIVQSLLYTPKRVLLKLVGALLVYVTLVNKVDRRRNCILAAGGLLRQAQGGEHERQRPASG